ncbi:glycosyltransferase [Paenibacillus sp. SI8]|uniref:CgeB family protein n=1 Tax=unclassified Paenibacillus TaxID=185978 RepID=UPI0034669C19
MKILFLENHPMWIHGLPNGFRDAGHQVKISGRLTPQKIPRLIASFRPDLIITLGWTREHQPKKRKWIRKYVKQSGIPHVYWATEDPTHTQTFTLPYIRQVKPDFIFTICQRRVGEYQKMGFKAAHLDFGYHPRVHHPVPVNAKYRADVAIVANAYPHILAKYTRHHRIKSLHQLISPLVKNKIPIALWGRQWSQMKRLLGAPIPRKWIRGYLHYTKANQVYSSAQIILGLQNQLTQVTQRTYEILGSGGFLITSDTPEIRRLFKPGKHLITSKSPHDTLRLVRYYLNHPQKMRQIRTAGKKAAAAHSYKQRALYMIRSLTNQGILSPSSTRKR